LPSRQGAGRGYRQPRRRPFRALAMGIQIPPPANGRTRNFRSRPGLRRRQNKTLVEAALNHALQDLPRPRLWLRMMYLAGPFHRRPKTRTHWPLHERCHGIPMRSHRPKSPRRRLTEVFQARRAALPTHRYPPGLLGQRSAPPTGPCPGRAIATVARRSWRRRKCGCSPRSDALDVGRLANPHPGGVYNACCIMSAIHCMVRGFTASAANLKGSLQHRPSFENVQSSTS